MRSLLLMATTTRTVQSPMSKAPARKKFAVPPVKVACLAWYCPTSISNSCFFFSLQYRELTCSLAVPLVLAAMGRRYAQMYVILPIPCTAGSQCCSFNDRNFSSVPPKVENVHTSQANGEVLEFPRQRLPKSRSSLGTRMSICY